ncbi:MAG: phosphatidate cytidylyltransferase [Rhodocyclaceae bacterium]|nr:phosphatidate cytidylyltransferase [Rhodocyclaceae bacterium]MBK9624551.1 phosphatidate cytidylyltransferase [Rhodocyclaceae bacterium]MBL0075889.1 phosphatidate cytidylyltransferase [Rhodocyclaceae bacterium]MBP6110144.1 phosphatidate cytidylyltransferase [Rhodocyclaceae bacterium]MBP6279313.1 phosphatidate cytidylyltransferase [Rhodocyclaceae bacterium]
MLKQRVITALLLVVLLGGVLFFLPATYVPLAFAGVVACAGWEWVRLMRLNNSAGYFFAVALMLVCWQVLIGVPESVTSIFGISALFWLLVAPLWFRKKWRLAGNDAFGYGIGLLVIVPTWLAMVVLFRASPWLLLAVMAICWVADISAYFVGRRFGRRKLAPTISPGKTWEGVVGGVIGVLIYGELVLSFSPLGDYWTIGPIATVLVLLMLTAVSVAGDLFESLLKRQADIKDSSQLLPGHGGVLDRIDSLTATLPLAALIYRCLGQ